MGRPSRSQGASQLLYSLALDSTDSRLPTPDSTPDSCNLIPDWLTLASRLLMLPWKSDFPQDDFLNF